jgi:mono/diheme cytochrome c family protein
MALPAVPVFEVSIMHRWWTVTLTLCVSAVVALLAGILFIYLGIYNVAALEQHGPAANWLFHTVALRSIGRRAQDIVVPKLDGPERIARGLALYRRNCLQCHGGPGVGPAAFAMGLMPGAPPLPQVAREWPANEVYWVVRNGIKMTAMPAWRYRMTDSELWDVVAFVETLPRLAPADYGAQVVAQDAKGPPTTGDDTGYAAVAGNAAHGKVALEQYACASCHIIPGVVAPPGRIGPTLAAMGDRSIVAGLLANAPEGMVAWIRHPQKVSPGTAMPDMDVSEQDARDMAAYLEALR